MPSIDRFRWLVLALTVVGCGHPATFSERDGRWVWSAPRPHGNSLLGVWVESATSAWAVGAAGTIVHFRDRREEIVDSGTSAALRAIWGSARDDIWAVGAEGTALHFDGRAWRPSPLPVPDGLQAVWGSGRSDVWAVGFTCSRVGAGCEWQGTGTILHWDGVAWSVVARNVDQGFEAVWGSGPADVYVGGGGPLWHFDGRDWSTESVGPVRISAIWGSGPADVWAVGQYQAVHFDGKAWSPVHSGATDLTTLTGTGPGQMWSTSLAGLRRFEGGGWRDDEKLFETAEGIGARPGGPVWVVGSSGQASVREAGAWHPVRRTPWPGHGVLVPDLNGAPVVLTLQGAWRLVDGEWRPDAASARGLDLGLDLHGAWSDPTGPWVWGSSGVARWDGSRWETRYRGAGLSSLAGDGRGHVWGVSRPTEPGAKGSLAIWDGQAWRRQTIDGEVTAVAGTGLDDLWSVGNSFKHWDGRTWQAVGPARAEVDYFDVCANARDDVWAVGRGGLAAHWDGKSWSAVTSGISESLDHLWCGGRDDVWAAGQGGFVVVWNGRSWRATPIGTAGLSAIQGGRSGLWVTGWGGAILRWQ